MYFPPQKLSASVGGINEVTSATIFFWWNNHNRRDSHMPSGKCDICSSTQQEEQQVVTFLAGVDVLHPPHPPAQVFNAEVFFWASPLMFVEERKKNNPSPVSTRRS